MPWSIIASAWRENKSVTGKGNSLSERTALSGVELRPKLKSRWKQQTEALGLKPLHTVPLMLLRNLVFQHPELMTTCFQTRKEEASPLAEETLQKRDLYGYNECLIDTSTESRGRTG